MSQRSIDHPLVLQMLDSGKREMQDFGCYMLVVPSPPPHSPTPQPHMPLPRPTLD